jgi:uncharacterized protein (TIGR00369 family)
MKAPSYGVVPAKVLGSQDGLSFLRAILAGRLPAPPISKTLAFRLVAVEHGRAVFEGRPRAQFYNPLGTVHGGYTATLLDSAAACAVHSTLAKGEFYTSVELKINFTRPIGSAAGLLRAEGSIIHRGRSVATAQAQLKDAADKLYGHATTTCMIFAAKVPN